ncbi:unnamed protein product [Alopecurus aequalis]
MTLPAAHPLRFGVRFNPTPQEALSLYLWRRIAGEPLPDTADIVHEAEVYDCEPDALAAAFPPLPKTANRFFFSTCKRKKAGRRYTMVRTAGAGRWVSNDKKMVKNGAEKTIGYQEHLRYKYEDKNRESDWLMEEYHYTLDGSAVVDGGDRERVFCRLYSKTGSTTLQQSAAGDHRVGLGTQEPGSSTMAVQPRQQEPVALAPVLPAMTQPQAIKKTPLEPSPVAITPARAPKRTTPQVTEQPRRKRAAALTALEVPPPEPRPNLVGCTTPKDPAWLTAVKAQAKAEAVASGDHAKGSTTVPTPVAITPARAPKRPAPEVVESPRTKRKRVVAVLPALEVPPPEDPSVEENHSLDDDDWLERMLESELEVEAHEEHAKIQEEEEGDSWLLRMMESEVEVEPPKVHTKIQDEEEGQHQDAVSLEGLVVDERGDDVVAQDLFDGLEDIDDPIDGEDWTSRPLSDYIIPW